ncbi:MAG TPA: hypothetical protein VJH94_03545 [Candidatus Paceibacterota bacterium]
MAILTFRQKENGLLTEEAVNIKLSVIFVLLVWRRATPPSKKEGGRGNTYQRASPRDTFDLMIRMNGGWVSTESGTQ